MFLLWLGGLYAFHFHGVGTMTEPIKFKPKDDYSEHISKKIVDGEEIEVVAIDEMTEAQWKKYCRDTGTEWFQRMNISV
jgi:hypothetical protein